MKEISVVGLGYIGLPTSILAAQSGYKVLGFDVNKNKVERINKGDPTIVEPEISSRLFHVLEDKKFKAYDEIQVADCFVIAVPTPFLKESKSNEIKKADLSYVFSAAEIISTVLASGNLVILESTVPVGTTAKLATFLEEKSGLKAGLDFFVAHCPERVLPGKIFLELVNNDRVIGGVCEKSSEFAKSFYARFVKGQLFLTDDKTAEMVKLVENSSRDVQIAFANQVAAMSNEAGIDPWSVIKLANKHPRVNILNPGCGVGGHCIAVDPWFLIQSFPESSKLLLAARKVNDEKPQKVVEDVLKICEKIKENQKRQPKILSLGLTFKPDIDDTRESPALKIANLFNLKKDLMELAVYDPFVKSEDIKHLGFGLIKSLVEGVEWADVVVVLVKHKQFDMLKEFDLSNKFVVDTCGLMCDLNSICSDQREGRLVKTLRQAQGERDL